MSERKGMGGAIRTVVVNGSTKRMSREEKDKQLLTCGACGMTAVAKGNFYFCKTRQWNKRYQKYYEVEF